MRYKYLTTPYRHQVQAVKKLRRNGYGGALLMAPRTGKSKAFIDWASTLYLEAKVDRILIGCPSTALRLNVWQEQWEEHCPYEYDIFVWDRKARLNGGLPEPAKDRLLVILVNYEAFSTPGKKLPSGRRSTKTGRIKNRNEIRRWMNDKTIIALDESHAIANTGSATHRTLVTLRNAPYRVILTGTVVTKASRPGDIYAQWLFLNPARLQKWENKTEFNKYFAVWRTIETPSGDTVSIFVKTRPERMDELHELMGLDAYSVEREDCFDLPPIDTQIIPVELSRSARAYDDMATKMIAEIRQYTAEAAYPIVKVLRLAQITGGFVTTDDRRTIIRVGREKEELLKPLMEQYLSNGEKFAVVARFKPELDMLTRLARSFKVPVYTIRGGVNQSQQYEDLRKARKHEDPFIYILQPHAAAEAIDLSFLSRMVWYSLTNRFVKFRQCCDRIALSRVSTTFTYLLAQGIDQLMYEVLQNDGQFLKAVHSMPERLLR